MWPGTGEREVRPVPYNEMPSAEATCWLALNPHPFQIKELIL